MDKGKGKERWMRIRTRICGNHQQWYQRLLPLYGSWQKRQLEARILKEQKRVLYRVGICGLGILLCLGSLMFTFVTERMQKGTFEDLYLQDGGQYVLEYGGGRTELILDSMTDSTEEQRSPEEIFDEARRQISREMLGENPDWNHVSGALYFPKSVSSGVSVRYETSDPARISENGLVDGIGSGEGIPVTIGVTMFLGSSMEQYQLQCIVVPPKTTKDAEQALQLRSEVMLSEIEKSPDERTEILQESLKEITVSEQGNRETWWMLFGMTGMVMILVIVGRFSKVEKEREQRKRELALEVPVLMDQLIMMMNAGLILSEALETAAFSAKEGDGRLFTDLGVLCRRADESKRSVMTLLGEYAVETGCSELVRFSTMLLDHIDRGSLSLIQQLKVERNYARDTQWKRKEERCRTMEIQLSGPLAILLSTILLLTIGPVMISV